MAKWVEFDILEVQQTGPKSAGIIKIEHVSINVDKISMVIATQIPSEISGPDGGPATKLGASLYSGLSMRAPSVIVENTKEEVLWKLEHGPFVEITQPAEDPEPKLGSKTQLKLIHPNE